ncbi:hypothetical protein GCK32_014926 [Trichostrongylus colubriformis]|uniref:Peptidase aspartic putative domain-containing protein n=1 Tax=Trichostrongylus colubriformis TaxID=6319 RepID=A0AAN8FK97_TRICO
MEKTCPLTSIELEDRKGNRHAFNLAVVDYISGTLQRTPLSEDDQAYLTHNNIALSVSSQEQSIAPRILLGCNDVFTLFENGLSHAHELPSGLRVLQSKIGYLVTGRANNVGEQVSTQVHRPPRQQSP